MVIPLNIRKKLADLYKTGRTGQFIVKKICDFYIWFQKIRGAKPYMDNNPLAVVSHKYKFLFIGVPKAATQTFLNSFYLDSNIRKSYEVDLIEKRPTCHTAYELYPDYTSFTLVRNPWARALSCYNSKIRDTHPLKAARILSLYKNLHSDMSFLDFTRWLLTDEGRDDIADRHWLSQYHFLTDKTGKICCQNIGRYETMEQDVQAIFDKIGLPETNLKTRAFKSGASAYQEIYCEEAKENIAKRYKKDIELLEYKFEGSYVEKNY